MKLRDIWENIDIYAICSTLNQIVNYIPIKVVRSQNYNKPVKILNITVKSESEKDSVFKRFDNKEWDKNLFDVLKKRESNIIYSDEDERNVIEIERKEVKYIKDELCKKIISKNKDDGLKFLDGICNYMNGISSENKILWNITGGQRSTVFAIQEFIKKNQRKNDYLLYLEGNSNKIVYGKLNNSGFQYEILDEKYSIDNLHIRDVFQLAGFEITNRKNELINFLDDCNKNIDTKECKQLKLCEKIYKHYRNENDMELGEFFRERLLELNKHKDKNGNMICNEEKVEKFWNELKKKDFKNEFDNEDKNILLNMRNDNQNKFGYILEYMSISSIVNTIIQIPEMKNYFIGVYHSINLNRIDKKFKEKDTTQLCEFDIVLLSKSGQVVLFECKSGVMSSDVAKARQYTAYAAGGVYGKPVLITPILQYDRKLINKIFKNKSSLDKADREKIGKYNSTVIYALRAAARANLEVWGIDEIGEKLKELYEEAL
ncbi:hypothetical protein ACFHWD_06260 [Clostridium sp. MT-14]|uniref:hypothetical protein n=1 Tax=Clostridium sp. MT-14 TaxID=3348360 RepID=UPI0035F49673